ncbi:MAG: hypothetical protein R2827_02860 [Bdellovibrionales bacterium]
MDALGVHYSMADDLNLKLHKRFHFIARPDVIRYDNLTQGSFGADPLKGGFYLLNIVLTRKNSTASIQPQDYITSWQQIVAVKNGYITSEVELSIDNMKLMGARNYLLVQVKPINETQIIFERGQSDRPKLERKVDQNKTLQQRNLIFTEAGLQTPTYKAPFIPLNLWQSPSMTVADDIDAVEFIAAAKRLKQQQLMALQAKQTQEQYEKYFNLKRINLSDSTSTQYLAEHSFFTSDSLNELIQQPLQEGFWETQKRNSLQYKLCRFWAQRFLPEKLSEFSQNHPQSQPLEDEELETVLREFQRRCISSVRKSRDFFNLDQQMIVGDVDPNSFQYMGGMSFNIGVGENFYLNKAQYQETRKSESNTMTFSVSAKDDIIPVVDIGLSYNQAWAKTQSLGIGMSQNASIGHTSGVYMVVQNSLVQFKALSYRKCLLIMPNSEALKQMFENPMDEALTVTDDDKGFFSTQVNLGFMQRNRERIEAQRMSRLKDIITDDIKLDVFESGLRLCLDEEKNNPIHLTESYYYVTQHFVAGDMQDPADLKNKPWLMSIRSDRDFKIFIKSIERHNEYNNVFADGHLPIHQLIESYSDYNGFLPSWPGVINLQTSSDSKVQNCTQEATPFGRVFNTVLDFLQGPFDWKYKPGIGFSDVDFFSLYFCQPESY